MSKTRDLLIKAEKPLVIVLGKRLFNDTLTAEGRSRVEALVDALAVGRLALTTSIAFCGGVTQGQTVSEAKAMYDYFCQLCAERHVRFRAENVLLEERSTSTVENIFEVSKVLLESGECTAGSALHVTFVSNDYHLKRIFEIQQLMDEQGLLRVLRERCAEQGAELSISYRVADHISVPYPHFGVDAQLFLLIDELTTYRVYLEGVARGVFARSLVEVRTIPYQLAQSALQKIKPMLRAHPELTGYFYDFAQLQQWIEESGVEQDSQTIAQIARLFNRTLIRLNRQFDPEQSGTGEKAS